jgi:chromosome segregation ATPase
VETSESVTVESFETIKSAMSELRSECAGFESFVVGMLDQLEELRVELAERESYLETERRHIAEQKSELDNLPEGAVQAHSTKARIEEIERLRTELKEAHEALESERQHASQSVSEIKGRFEETQKELQTARGELESVRVELSSAYDRLQKAPESGQPIDEKRLAEFEEERAVLEAELEQTRRRAAELANQMAEQKKQLAEERSGWSEELKQLRTLVEKRVNNAPAAPAHVQAAASGAPAATGGNADPVVGSILAQFARLQKDAAMRRAKK